MERIKYWFFYERCCFYFVLLIYLLLLALLVFELKHYLLLLQEHVQRLTPVSVGLTDMRQKAFEGSGPLVSETCRIGWSSLPVMLHQPTQG